MFNGFKRRRVSILNEKEEREIQITPFIDVVLVLLIIFMITSPAVLSGVAIDLPGGSEQSDQTSDLDFLTITFNKDGQIYLGDDIITINNIILSIKNKIGNVQDKTIFIRGDKSIKYGDIMTIIDILNRAGYKKTILVTDGMTK